MKIIKKANIALTESEEVSKNLSTNKLADEIVDAGEESDKEISKAEAQELAKTAEEVIDNGGVAKVFIDDDEPYETDNALTRALDNALDNCLDAIEDGRKPQNQNLLVVGLPGTGKTAMVDNWGKKNKDIVEICVINAKDNNLNDWLNGYTARDEENPDYVKSLKSKNIDKFRKVIDPDDENSTDRYCVIVLDEFNRQRDTTVRGTLLSFINEHKTGYGEYLPNILFAIAMINPYDGDNEGVVKLDDAEISRFSVIDMSDESPEARAENKLSWKKFFNQMVAREVKNVRVGVRAKFKSRRNGDAIQIAKDKIMKYLRKLDLGNFIISNSRFNFNNVKDQIDIRNSSATPLTNRTLSIGLDAGGSNVSEYRYWIDKKSNFLPRTKDMMNAILDEYENLDEYSDTDLINKYEEIIKENPHYDDIFGKVAAEPKAEKALGQEDDAGVADLIKDADEEGEDALAGLMNKNQGSAVTSTKKAASNATPISKSYADIMSDILADF